jgi:hypothetical protein
MHLQCGGAALRNLPMTAVKLFCRVEDGIEDDMKSFELHDAHTVQEAVGLLNKFGPTSKVVAAEAIL